MRVGDLLVLMAGVGIGLWVGADLLREEADNLDESAFWIVLIGSVLGGASFVGVPMLLWEHRHRPRKRWGPGRLFWFAHGSAAWLLWPPIVVSRRMNPGQRPIDAGTAEICYYYGTPLMAVYVTLALLAGRWVGFGRRRRRLGRRPWPWRERFGLLLGLAWACVGLYVLKLIYQNTLSK